MRRPAGPFKAFFPLAATPPYSLLAWPHCIASLGDRAEAEKVADRRVSAATPEQINYSLLRKRRILI